MNYRLGDGWEQIKTLKHVGEGYDKVPKYADLSIYRGNDRILDLGIDHYEIRFEGDIAETYHKLTNLVRELNGEKPKERDLRAEHAAHLMEALDIAPAVARKLVDEGFNSVAAFEGTEARDFLDMKFSAEETMTILDGLRKAGV